MTSLGRLLLSILGYGGGVEAVLRDHEVSMNPMVGVGGWKVLGELGSSLIGVVVGWTIRSLDLFVGGE